VDDHVRAGVLEQCPHVVEQPVTGVELPHLHMHLEHLRTGVEARAYVVGDARLGVEVAECRQSGVFRASR